MLFKNPKLNELQSHAVVSYKAHAMTFDQVAELLIAAVYRQAVRDCLEKNNTAIGHEVVEENLFDGADSTAAMPLAWQKIPK